MLKKPITYTNVDGKTVTENFYFNMTKAELLKLELSDEEVGFMARIESIQGDDVPGKKVLDVFDGILRHAYGVRTDEGKFIKTPQAFDEFLASEAYSDLLFDLATNAQTAAEFVQAIMPADLASQVSAEAAAARKVQDVVPNVFEENGPEKMSDAELRALLGAGDQGEPEERLTNGLTDNQIRELSGRELAQQSREVLIRAYQLKQQ